MSDLKKLTITAKLTRKIRLWHATVKRKRFERFEERCREAHRKGHDCAACCLHVTPNGGLYRDVASMIWFCKYDVPGRAGKLRHDFSVMRSFYEN